LPFANRVHHFHAGKRTVGRPKGLEAEHRTREALHCTMILPDSLHANDQTVSAPPAGGFTTWWIYNDAINQQLDSLPLVRKRCRGQSVLHTAAELLDTTGQPREFLPAIALPLP
jgi:hypothetical protein